MSAINENFHNLSDNEAEEHRKASANLPYFFRGRVIHGFGRGGRTLNCPTANLEEIVINKLPPDFVNGVYAGFARLPDSADDNKLTPMVMSVGHNPQFHNEKKTLEVHILKTFEQDFYGSVIEGVAVRFLRPMRSYKSLTELIDVIDGDKRAATAMMDNCLKHTFEKNVFFA